MQIPQSRGMSGNSGHLSEAWCLASFCTQRFAGLTTTNTESHVNPFILIITSAVPCRQTLLVQVSLKQFICHRVLDNNKRTCVDKRVREQDLSTLYHLPVNKLKNNNCETDCFACLEESRQTVWSAPKRCLIESVSNYVGNSGIHI